MKKRTLIVFTIFLLLFLPSCSKGNRRRPNLSPEATLTLALRSGIYSDVIKKNIATFEAENNVICNVWELSEDSLHSLVFNDSSNTYGAYDLCMVDGSWMAEYIAEGVLSNLSELGYSLDDDIIPATTAICYHDSGLYLAPYYGNVTVLLYNKLIAKEAGYSPEEIKSIYDLLEICRFSKKRHNLGFMYRGDTMNNIVVDFLPILLSYGGWVVDGNNRPTVNTDVFKRALSSYLELIDTGRAAKKEDLIAAIANKSAAMGIGWPGWYTPTRNSSMDYLALTGRASSSSLAFNANIYGIWTIGIPSNSQNKKYAIKLLRYLMDPERQKASVAYGGVPCRYSSLKDPHVLEKFPQYEVVCKALESGVYRPIIKEWPEFYGILGKEMKAIIDKEKSIDDGLKDAQRELEKIL